MSEFIKPHTIEGWEHLCKLQTERIVELTEVVGDLIDQFAYISRGKRSTGGLSALEAAFRVLGLHDPHPAPAYLLCDEPGCDEQSTCGTPTPSGYRRTCGKHTPKLEVHK